MVVYHSLDDLQPDYRNVITVGTFDGVHRGHRYIIGELLKIAAANKGIATVVTFDPHPQLVLRRADRDGIKILTTKKEKIELLRRLGVEKLIVIPFSIGFSGLSAEAYIREVVHGRIGLRGMVIGYDHAFGRNREGNIRFLQTFGRELGFEVYQLQEFANDGTPISSTRIRRLLAEGNVEKANHLLGYAYRVRGIVTRGDGRGKALGFPTANLCIPERHKLLPGHGVYVVMAVAGSKQYLGMANLGVRPTFGQTAETLEVHLLDFHGDLYDQSLELAFYRKIRNEQKFPDVEALREQLVRDRDYTRNYAAKNLREMNSWQ